MAGYIRVRRCDVSQDSFERTKGLAMEQAQNEHTQMLVCKVVGIVKTQEPVYESLEDTEQEPPNPSLKVLDVSAWQDADNKHMVHVEVNHVDPKLFAFNGRLVSKDGFSIIARPYERTWLGYTELVVGDIGLTAYHIYLNEQAAMNRVSLITRLVDKINRSEDLSVS
jgi:hypothetical protein